MTTEKAHKILNLITKKKDVSPELHNISLQPHDNFSINIHKIFDLFILRYKTENIKLNSSEELIINIYYRKGLNAIKNKYLFGFLHEIGHIQTLEYNTDESYFEYQKILKDINQGEISLEEGAIMYSNLEKEHYATVWANDFYIKNKKEIDKIMEGR